MASKKPAGKKAPKTIPATRVQLAAGVPVPTGRPVKLTVTKKRFWFSV